MNICPSSLLQHRNADSRFMNNNQLAGYLCCYHGIGVAVILTVTAFAQISNRKDLDMKALSRPIERRKFQGAQSTYLWVSDAYERRDITQDWSSTQVRRVVQIQALKDIPIAVKLSIEVFFAAGFELSTLEEWPGCLEDEVMLWWCRQKRTGYNMLKSSKYQKRIVSLRHFFSGT